MTSNLSTIGEFFRSLILQDCIEVKGKKKVFVMCSQNMKSGTFTLQSCIVVKGNVQKSVMHVQSCFANLNLLLFSAVLIAVAVAVV